ncbi:MAG: hypothetical protein ACHQVK_05405, partial [Candidatus Paceibacterales bacterium]
AKLVDKISMFIAPKIMGDEAAVSSVRGLSIKNLNSVIRLNSFSVSKIAGDILVEGYVLGDR